MVTQDCRQVVHQAELIYRQVLRDKLEEAHCDEFLAIEPASGDYYLGQTLSEAIGAARKAHPDRLAHAIRIGHRAAVHLGALS